MLIVREVDLIGSFSADIDFHFLRELNKILNVRSLYDSEGDLFRLVHDGLELVGAHLDDDSLS